MAYYSHELERVMVMQRIFSRRNKVWRWISRILGWGSISFVVILVCWLILILVTMIGSIWDATPKEQGRDFVLTPGEEVFTTWIMWYGAQNTPVVTYTADGELQISPDCTLEAAVVKCFHRAVLSLIRRPEVNGEPYTFRAETTNVHSRVARQR